MSARLSTPGACRTEEESCAPERLRLPEPHDDRAERLAEHGPVVRGRPAPVLPVPERVSGDRPGPGRSDDRRRQAAPTVRGLARRPGLRARDGREAAGEPPLLLPLPAATRGGRVRPLRRVEEPEATEA